MQLDDLSARAARIRLPHRRLAALAQVSKDTICSSFSGRHNPLHTTVTRMAEALQAEELALRDHLLRLHPLPPQPQKETNA